MDKNITNILGYGINSERFTIDDCFIAEAARNRVIRIYDEIRADTIADATSTILCYNSEDSKLKPEERKPIILAISSPGGSVLDGFALIDIMKNSITPIWTVNIGYCFSMAFHIFICGDKRFSLPSSIFLLHDGQTGNFDSTLKLQDYAEFEKKHRNTLILDNILNHTTMSEKEYRRNERIEWYMFAEEAKRLGITDHILDEKFSLFQLADFYK